ncbi:MAG: zinc ABC transporter substrate-binding protein [Alphaproteobacteria bacterium]|nr:zinc ABC transporter substrate-binding protein [Alphaproteobacteria bacterium]
MRWIHALLLLLFAMTLARPAQAATRVVATVPDLAALAAEIGGEHVQVTALSLPTQDPHFVDARPNLALELSKADLLLVVGLQLEVGWLPALQTGSRNPKILQGAAGYLDCSQFVTLLQVPTQQLSRAMGDIHPGGNPHYLYDPRAVRSVALGIAERLAQVDPAHADAFRANAQDFVGRLDAARVRWEADLAGLKGQPIIAFHNSWPYLADWLGFDLIMHIEPKPGIPPTPAHVSHVLQAAREQGVKVILQEAYFPTTTSQLVADKAGAKLVVLAGGTDFNAGQGWIANMDAQVAALKAGLGG